VALNKEGIRVLGVGESYRGESSVLAGLVMRGDLRIDGAAFAEIEVGGLDATSGVLDVWDALDRSDVHAVLLSGCVIAWFNVVDLWEVHRESGVPVICVTYEESDGLEDDVRRHFEGEEVEKRLDAYRGLGERSAVDLGTGYEAYVRSVGLDLGDAERLLERFTVEGRRPEPLRVARLAARGVLDLL